ncbi:complement factor D-like [Heteronotia binoei]|uniref:complement factor D-like n=1 Tax=Heteronotia binoei TaxID=13085 RepID=UPI00292FECD3|nr:complement factor D-like [Heteronotia binoei]
MGGFSFWALFLWAGVFHLCEARPRGRILRGQETLPHQRPYMVSLQVAGKHICGGFLIADQWVLSAAHCLEDAGNETLRVLVGAHSLSEAEPNKRLLEVKALFPHPNSSVGNNHDDLLLIQLGERASINVDVQVLVFQREDRDVPAGTQCEVAGWGFISNTGRLPDKLHHVELSVISRTVCNTRIHYDGDITEKLMCTESKKKDSCKGDSGGPLVCNGVAEGVVATGARICGYWKKPGIYTRIPPYINWIESVWAMTQQPTEGPKAAAGP